METFLQEHGLWAVFLGALFERDLVCVVAGILAHLKVFPIEGGVGAALVGSFTADTFLYFVGRKFSPKIQKFRFYAKVQRKLDVLRRKFGSGAIVVSQFLYGFRTSTMIFFGLRELPLKTFLLFDFAGCLLLVVALETLGYFVSGTAEQLLGKVKQMQLWILGGLIVSGMLIWIAAKLFKKWFAEKPS
jgi:membrane protein DedA with SNARE-associated domain